MSWWSGGFLIKLTFSPAQFTKSQDCVLMWKVIKEQDLKNCSSFAILATLAPWSDREAICLISSKLAEGISRFSYPRRTDGDHSGMLQLAKCHVAHCKGLRPGHEKGRGWRDLSGEIITCMIICAGNGSISYPLCHSGALTTQFTPAAHNI